MWFVALGLIILLLVAIISVQYYQLAKRKEQLDYVKPLIETVKNVKDIIYYCETPQLKYRYLSPGVNQLGPNTHDEHMKNPYKILEIVHPEDREKLENKVLGKVDFSKPFTIRLLNDKGNYIWFEEYATPVYKDGKLVAVQGIFRNNDEKIKLQKQLEYEVSHDGLTNVYNRSFFQTKLGLYNKVKDVPMGIIICDLDQLKYINDNFGHQTGDRLIIEAANILTNCANEEMIIARIGGDEFAILLPNVVEEDVVTFINKVIQNLNYHNTFNESLPIHMSIGYSYIPSSIRNMECLYSEADHQMYTAKNAKKVLAKLRK
ncbi:sensor domain-containing diguanylate cyclase [Lysinibacillus sp. SGAir0095]|uniref:sensor domain-containing diguanylate cyclase n=1 Tax=Lysinibacillus sp. SGAir0095 TaxID=2070463 RepID=UPI0010CD6166|nr:sensor domain-containing diguanylate cyclase [Lysinibacillus sp. SGAir0095]QCR34253.1 diguanylate cyclase [Lysinibacillus sp. SGAir0095]